MAGFISRVCYGVFIIVEVVLFYRWVLFDVIWLKSCDCGNVYIFDNNVCDFLVLVIFFKNILN